MKDRDKLLDETNRDIKQMEEREKEPATLSGMVFFGGTVGLLFVIPLIAGAYLGKWLDSLAEGYSVRWTISLIVLGIVVGGYNVFHFIKGKT